MHNHQSRGIRPVRARHGVWRDGVADAEGHVDRMDVGSAGALLATLAALHLKTDWEALPDRTQLGEAGSRSTTAPRRIGRNCTAPGRA